MAARKYYTMAQRRDDGRWSPEFGSYDREDVEAEIADYRDHGVLKRDLKLLTTGAGQASINAAVAALNGEAR